MIDAVIVLLVIVVLMFALKGTVKHFRGEGACCGGGGSSSRTIPEKKLAGPKQGEKVMQITGMHCDKCAATVTKAINKIDGASAKVSLKKGQAVISYDRNLDNDVLRKAVEAQGFVVTKLL